MRRGRPRPHITCIGPDSVDGDTMGADTGVAESSCAGAVLSPETPGTAVTGVTGTIGDAITVSAAII